MDPWIAKILKHVQRTPPTCLTGFTSSPIHLKKWNDSVGWTLNCGCGHSIGSVLGHSLKSVNTKYDGPAVYVSPLAFQCSACGKVTEIIDTGKHGYNSEIGKPKGESYDSNYRGNGVGNPIPCPKCTSSEFTVHVEFGHSHFDLIQDEPELENFVQDYFDSFACIGKCSSCGNEESLAEFELA